MLQCSLCKEWKQENEFQVRKDRRRGFTSQCKKCTKEYRRSERSKAVNRKYRLSEKGRKVETEYRNSEKRKAVLKQYYNTKGKNTIRQYVKANPNKIKGQRAVHKAVAKGSLVAVTTLKCRDCNTQASDYHHWSYDKEHWLDVIPLCRQCHINRHKDQAQ